MSDAFFSRRARFRSPCDLANFTPNGKSLSSLRSRRIRASSMEDSFKISRRTAVPASASFQRNVSVASDVSVVPEEHTSGKNQWQSAKRLNSPGAGEDNSPSRSCWYPWSIAATRARYASSLAEHNTSSRTWVGALE